MRVLIAILVMLPSVALANWRLEAESWRPFMLVNLPYMIEEVGELDCKTAEEELPEINTTYVDKWYRYSLVRDLSIDQNGAGLHAVVASMFALAHLKAESCPVVPLNEF